MLRIDVTAFLEPGEYRASDAWLRQYRDRVLDDDLGVNRAIRPIAGATLTARAINSAVRRVLAIDEVSGKARTDAMKRWERWAFNLFALAVAASGFAYFWMKYLVETDDPFAVVNHPWQAAMLHLHVLASPPFVLLFGVILNSHIMKKLRAPRMPNRKTGPRVARDLRRNDRSRVTCCRLRRLTRGCAGWSSCMSPPARSLRLPTALTWRSASGWCDGRPPRRSRNWRDTRARSGGVARRRGRDRQFASAGFDTSIVTLDGTRWVTRAHLAHAASPVAAAPTVSPRSTSPCGCWKPPSAS